MSRPTYYDFLNNMDNMMNSNALRANEQLLYHTLLMINNRRFWIEWIGCTDLYLTERMGIGKTALINARNTLKQYGMIDFVTSKKRGTSTKYKICDEFCSVFCSSETDNKQASNKPQTEQQTNHKSAAYKEKRIKKKDLNNIPNPFEGEFGKKVDEWLCYKEERRQKYTPTGLKILFDELEKQRKAHNEAFVIKCIDISIVNNWQGLFFDRVKEESKSIHKECSEYSNLAELTSLKNYEDRE